MEPLPPALGARPVPGGQRDGLIQEEQFRIPAWRHHGTFAALEVEKAGNPTPVLERTEDLALLIVQRSAPVAHQGPTGMGSNNHAPGVHTVLQRHAGSEALRIARLDPVLW